MSAPLPKEIDLIAFRLYQLGLRESAIGTALNQNVVWVRHAISRARNHELRNKVVRKKISYAGAE